MKIIKSRVVVNLKDYKDYFLHRCEEENGEIYYEIWQMDFLPDEESEQRDTCDFIIIKGANAKATAYRILRALEKKP